MDANDTQDAHTPNPWRITGPIRHDYEGLEIGNDRRIIAVVLAAGPVPGPEEWANARLIAAAPRLLKAARAALKRMAEVYRDTFDSRMDNDPLVIELRAAIAQSTAGEAGDRP